MKNILERIKMKKLPRNKKGHYIKDDPSTPENEAWTTKVKKAMTPKKKKK